MAADVGFPEKFQLIDELRNAGINHLVGSEHLQIALRPLQLVEHILGDTNPGKSGVSLRVLTATAD